MAYIGGESMIKITTDSTCDLPAWVLEQHHISVTPWAW